MADESKELIAGSIAGGVGKLVEYPFDTIKVRLQSQSLASAQYSGAIDCLRQSIRNEGFTSLYKGVSVPIVAAGAENAVLFSSFNYFDNLLASTYEHPAIRATVCGSLSGVVASYVLTPIELIKCRIQVNSSSRTANIARVIADTWRHEGIATFWRGQTGTMLREGGGSSAWFGTYYALKDEIGSLLAGACAGVAYNLSLYPADSIKSRMQTEAVRVAHTPKGEHVQPASTSFWQTGRQIVRQTGFRGLYRGSLITCLRAGPSNAVIFTVYEHVRKYLGYDLKLETR